MIIVDIIVCSFNPGVLVDRLCADVTHIYLVEGNGRARIVQGRGRLEVNTRYRTCGTHGLCTNPSSGLFSSLIE